LMRLVSQCARIRGELSAHHPQNSPYLIKQHPI